MVDRYFKIYGKLDRVDDALVDVIRTARENVQLKSLYEDFKKLKGVNKKLQAEMLSLHDVRLLFNQLIKHFPTTWPQYSHWSSFSASRTE
ncbi:hypothetical protein PC129_g16451 [Phytophthora cactorum]|uniref:Uncharacterized protein n=1 Tax=Phytophthora cactorum TaxID=29920 RepID=A0A329SUN3_9STRA|nr:hypothetical protein Pcac1_g21603 [Phytophthora cactorum]KAG2808327.1 hypothetical protein PC111_g16546 [Phytophthora cactorum]KAG2857722.1 hypothetical protein PC113_g10433 [Phytophthora cactorum]KAG2908899.1 hypothetical protein PC114_g10276 [Phytophthora cactorum]KAG2939497.1 hypothetical protein PC117_g10923 [Phytophthora cactorum]